MSQRDFMRAFDAMAATAFAGVGLADKARCIPLTGGTAVDCTVMVDRSAVEFGDIAPVVSGGVRITFQKAELGEYVVREGSRIDLLEDGQVAESFLLQKLDQSDASIERWWAVRA